MCEIFLSFLATTPHRLLAAHWLGGCWAFAGDYDVVFEDVAQAGELRALFALLRPDLFLFSRIASHPTFRSSFWTSFLKVGECILRSIYHFFTGGSAGTIPGQFSK